MATKKELSQMTKSQLREIAKQHSIVGRWDMKKDELVEAIFGAIEAKDSKESIVKDNKVAKDEKKIEAIGSAVVKNENEQQPEDITYDKEQRLRYVENVKIGTLVAFKLDGMKCKAAKVVNKSSKNKKLKVETEYGAVYIVPYEKVLWVRTGKRWPSGIMKLLKSRAR